MGAGIMGERFYLAQLQAIGTCPGNPKRRRSKMAWTDEKKQEAIDMYLENDPTPETSIEIVEKVAEELEETVNGVRMILIKAEVYVKKVAGASKGPSKEGAKEGSTRVSKADAQASLESAITDAGQEADMAIIEKLTGKACAYLTQVITAINS